GIGDVAEAKAERLDLAMALTKGQRIDHAPCPFDVHHLPGLDLMPVEDRRIFAAGRRLEAIVEALTEGPPGGRIVECLDAAMAVIGDHAEIIYAVHMIGMIVGVEHAVEPARARIE